jgi:peptide/nickel transport system permease protein
VAGRRQVSRFDTFLGRLAVELEPRVKEFRHSFRLLRKSPLAVVGLGIVLFFLVLAAIGPLLAPYEYQYNDSEKNAQPWGRPLVLRNESSRVQQEAVGDWVHPDYIGREDGLYTRSDQVGNVLILRRFDLGTSVYTDLVSFVGIIVQANSTAGAPATPGSFLSISVSWDNGTTWSDPVRTPLRFSDVDGAWFLLDFSNAIPWNAFRLSQMAVRVVHDYDPAFTAWPIGVDILRVIVRFYGLYHALGTTEAGEDVLSGLFLGARISVRIGLIAVGVTVLIGAFLGALSGYFGGPLDELIMRVTDVFLSIPGLILALAVAAALGRSLDTVVYALIFVSWPLYTRLVRGQALSVRENAFIEAAKASGASDIRIVFRHILPNTRAPILVQASLDVGTIVLVAAGLSFLGLGAQPGTPEWGLMVSRGFSFFPQNWWQVSFSGLMIFLFVLGFNLLGDGLRDILDPRIRR